MQTIRNILVALGKSRWFNSNSKSAFYVLLVAFIILLIATETIIKQTFIPL
jgi:hypothetical protein